MTATVTELGGAATLAPPRSWTRPLLWAGVLALSAASWRGARGTALAIVCSVLLALLAASNLTPWWVYQPVRRALDACRSINEMVFALLFVAAALSNLYMVRRQLT